MRAVIYCRVSTTEQAQNLSLPTQERLCREYARREGFEIAKVFIERGESAKTIQRPEFLALLTFCRLNKGKVHALIVHSLTRFSRNTADHHGIRGLLAGFGIALRSVTERIDDSPSGRLMEAVLAGLAQFDNDLRAERTTVGMQEAISRGRWVWMAPLGFTNTRDRLGPSMRHDPERAPLIRQAFELYAAGGRNQRELLREITALGLKSRAGKPLTAQSLQNLLRNPAYAGRVVSRRWKAEYPGDFEPVVSESLFGNVQHLLAGKGTGAESRRPDHPEFPLRRFVRCHTCGTPLTGSRSRGRSQSYAYYHCRRGCEGVSASKGVLEGEFVGLLESLRPRPEYLSLFRAVVLDCWKAERQNAESVSATLDRRVLELRQKLQRVDDAHVLERTIDQRSYSDLRDRLREQLAVTEIQRNEARLAEIDVEGVVSFAEHVIDNAAALWTTADPPGRRALQQALFPEGLRWNQSGFGTAVTCSAFSVLDGFVGHREGMASPPGFEPGSWP